MAYQNHTAFLSFSSSFTFSSFRSSSNHHHICSLPPSASRSFPFRSSFLPSSFITQTPTSKTTTPKMSLTPPQVHVGQVSFNLVSLLSQLSAAAISDHSSFNVAVSGGSLPKLLALGLETVLTQSTSTIDLSKWNVFLADERIVPLSHADSNYREIVERFNDIGVDKKLQLVAINPDLTPVECAKDYQEKVTRALGTSPKFDAVLLGLGPDGHTCSLFPEHSLLDVTDRIIAHIEDSPKPPPNRITLTLPTLNQAKNVIFVCTGAGKAPAVKDILENKESNLPGALVRPSETACVWFLDEGAAGELSSSTVTSTS